MKGPLQKNYVSERLRLQRGGRVPLKAAAALGQQYEGKVRPGGLRLEKRRRARTVSADRARRYTRDCVFGGSRTDLLNPSNFAMGD
jgi:hypothetical protein